MSQQLTVGTRDANGIDPMFFGFVRLTAVPGNTSTPEDEADVRVLATLSDVCSKSDLSDYTGEVEGRMPLRITDKLNGSSLTEPATVSDVPLEFAIPCQATGSATVGGSCGIDTTVDALTGGAVVEGRRSKWELGSVQVWDGGPEGLASSSQQSLFAGQGIFAP